MSSTSFTVISAQFSTSVGLSIFSFGIIGNLINLYLLFSTRSNPCSFLLFISSFFNLIALLVGLLPRVLSIGFGIDASSTSMIWCKSRLFISYTVALMSLTCLCLASFDRLLTSCRSVTWRNRSNLSTAKIVTLIAILMLITMNVPYLIFYTLIQVKTATGNTATVCSLASPGLVLYGSYFLRPILFGILPTTILGLTGWLTYRNITSITSVQRHGTLQRSLTLMILLQIVVVIIPIAPFATINMYQAITSSMIKTPYQLAIEMFVIDITNIILYINYASNFYVYLISSSSYRRDFLRLVLFCYNQNHWNNRIRPMGREQFEMKKVSERENLPQPVHEADRSFNHCLKSK